MRADLPTAYPDYFAKNPAYQRLRRAGRAHRRGAERAELGRAIWQTFRDAYSESVIFGKKPVPDAFSAAAEKVDQLAAGPDATAHAAAAAHGRARTGGLGRRGRPRRAARSRVAAVLGRHPVGLRPGRAVRRLHRRGLRLPARLRRLHVASTTTSSPRPVRPSTGRSSGCDNYSAVLTDPAVRRSFGNIGVFLLINVPLTVVLSLLLAIALNRRRSGPGRSSGSASTCRT